MKFSIQGLIDEEIKQKNNLREKRNQTTWHASSLGSCLCGQYLQRLGLKPDEPFDQRTLRVFNMGNKIEDWIVDLITKQEKYDFETQGRVFDEKLNFSGYWDIWIKDLETLEEEIIEVKSKNSRAFWYMEKQGEGAQKQHQMQLWSYLWLTKVERGRIVYISKDDQCILEYPIFRNNEDLKKIVFDQLEILNEAWEKKIPPLPALKDSWQAKYCGFHKQCKVQEKYLERIPLFYQNLEKVVNPIISKK